MKSPAWIAGVLAAMVAVSCAMASTVVIEPDAFPAGTVLTHAFPGVSLTAWAEYTLNSPDVLVASSGYASTGTHVFSYNGQNPPLWGDGVYEVMRASFAGGASSVSLDFVGLDYAGTARLSAYDSFGSLVDQVSTPLTSGYATLTVHGANIAYIDAEGDPINRNAGYNLDRLVYSPVPEPATLSLLAFGGFAALRRRAHI